MLTVPSSLYCLAWSAY